MKTPCTDKQLGELATGLEFIATKIAEVRKGMKDNGLQTVMLDISTAQGHVTWLTNWSTKIYGGVTSAQGKAARDDWEKKLGARKKRTG